MNNFGSCHLWGLIFCVMSIIYLTAGCSIIESRRTFSAIQVNRTLDNKIISSKEFQIIFPLEEYIGEKERSLILEKLRKETNE